MTEIYCTIALALLMIWLTRGSKWVHLRRSLSELERLNIQLESDAFALNTYIAVNRSMQIVFANKRTEKMFGWAERELLGKDVSILFPDREKVVKFLHDHPDGDDETLLRTTAITRLDRKLEVEFISGLWKNEMGEYYTIIIRDITHRVANEQAYRQLQDETNAYREIYSRGEKIGRVGFWYLDDLTGKVRPTPGGQDLYGIAGDSIDVADIVFKVIPEDKVRVAETMRKAKDEGIGYRMTYKLHSTDGYINTIESIAEPVYEDGMRVGLIGMARLISKETTA
jgi:PAS domain S-box-containing protein